MLDMQMWFDKTRWQKVKLGDVCEKVRMINTKSYLYGTFRYIDIGSINAENNRVNEALEIDWVEASPRARQIVQYQDTLFSTVRVNLQRIAFLTKEYEQCIASTGFCVIRANEALADRKFIFYSCLTPQFTDNLIHLQAGTAYPAVSNKMVFGQEILLPPLDEQRRIADMLSKIEDAIAQTEQQAQALLAYRKGLINQLFQEHGSFGGVVQPDDIELVKFEHFAIHQSKRVEPQETDLEIYVGLEHLDPDDLKIHRYGKPQDVIGTKIHVEPGDIIFGKRRAYQRKVAVADFHGICSAHAMVLRTKPEHIIPDFLPYLMQSDMFMNRAVQISEGSLSPTIKWKVLAQQKFFCPVMKKQQAIVDILRKFDQALEQTKRHAAALTAFKKGLLNELIGGSV